MLDILFPGCIVEMFEIHEQGLVLTARSNKTAARCPVCGVTSAKVSGYYRRHPHDLPLAGHLTKFCLKVKRFYCLNHSCTRTTFAESFDPWLARYAHRSGRLSDTQSYVAVMLSAKASEDLLEKLAIPVSHDTALNLVCKRTAVPQGTPRVLGVDDFALRKRETYGTLLLDLETHKVVDVLPDRTSATLISWLKAHPGIEVISRDRSQEYKSACDEGAPEAVQVADRWHLLKNFSDLLKRWFERHKKYLVEPLPDGEFATGAEMPRQLRARTSYERALQAKLETRRKRQTTFETAKRLKAEGFSLSTIAAKLGVGRSTLSRWFAQGTYANKQRSRILEAYRPYLRQRWEAGISNKMQLYREIMAQGFTGAYGLVYAYFAELEAGIGLLSASKKQNVQRYSAYEATRLFTRQRATLNRHEIRRLEQLFKNVKEAELCYELAQRFVFLFEQEQAPEQTLAAFDRWLKDTINSGIDELARLAKGFSNDRLAIGAALTLPWSNGPTEGKITRLKLLKRQMYGRASFDLLRQKVLLAA